MENHLYFYKKAPFVKSDSIFENDYFYKKSHILLKSYVLVTHFEQENRGTFKSRILSPIFTFRLLVTVYNIIDTFENDTDIMTIHEVLVAAS